MKHVFRFLGRCENIEDKKQLWLISEEEFRHLHKILKLEVGDEVEVFDGQSHSAVGQIESIKNQQALVNGIALPQKENPVEKCAVALGLLKPGLVDDILPSLTELGLGEIHIFLQDQQSSKRVNQKVYDRWEKIILAAAKQCKRDVLPVLRYWKNFDDMLKSLSSSFENTVYLDASSKEYFLTQIDENLQKSSNICAVVGSEKGFTSDETSKLDSFGFIAQHLGYNILRAQTSSIAVATLLANHKYKADFNHRKS